MGATTNRYNILYEKEICTDNCYEMGYDEVCSMLFGKSRHNRFH